VIIIDFICRIDNREYGISVFAQTVTYYQWIPMILLFQAFLFYVPTIFWHALNKKSGVDADDILQVAGSLGKSDSQESHDRKLGLLVKSVDRFLGSRQESEHTRCGVRCVLRIFSCATFGRRFVIYNYVCMLRCCKLHNLP